MLPVCYTLITWHNGISLPLSRTEQSTAPSYISLLSPPPSQPLYEEYFHMDPVSPETRWQLIVHHIFMSGELFHIGLKMKINCFSVLCGEQGTHLHFLLCLIHLHIGSFSVFLYPWTTGLYVFCLLDVVQWCRGLTSTFPCSFHRSFTQSKNVIWWFSICFDFKCLSRFL